MVLDAKGRENRELTWRALGFPEWFGEFNNTSLLALRFRFRTIKRTLAGSSLRIECNKLQSYVCRKDPYAHVEPGIWTIWLCPSYWCESGFASEEKTQTFVHEAAHIVALGTDARYFPDDSRDLAQTNPARARANADNLAYFATSVAFGYPP
jgi:hypothetical protein